MSAKERKEFSLFDHLIFDHDQLMISDEESEDLDFLRALHRVVTDQSIFTHEECYDSEGELR